MIFIVTCEYRLFSMEVVPIRCIGNDSKKYDDKVWLEDVNTIVQLNNKEVNNLRKCDLKNGDQVLVKFPSSKAKKPKLYNGVVEFPPVLQAIHEEKLKEASDSEEPTPKKMKAQKLKEASESEEPALKEMKAKAMKPLTGMYVCKK